MPNLRHSISCPHLKKKSFFIEWLVCKPADSWVAFWRFCSMAIPQMSVELLLTYFYKYGRNIEGTQQIAWEKWCSQRNRFRNDNKIKVKLPVEKIIPKGNMWIKSTQMQVEKPRLIFYSEHINMGVSSNDVKHVDLYQRKSGTKYLKVRTLICVHSGNRCESLLLNKTWLFARLWKRTNSVAIIA